MPWAAIRASGCILKRVMDFEISPSELKQILVDQPNASAALSAPILLDVREPWEHDAARIEGSILMPMGDVPGRAHQELDPEAHIVAICHHGVRSLNVAVWLRNQGFENAQSLRGGINAWSAEIDPTVPRY
jgi:rhodanese-related sulfurtransferase